MLIPSRKTFSYSTRSYMVSVYRTSFFRQAEKRYGFCLYIHEKNSLMTQMVYSLISSSYIVLARNFLCLIFPSRLLEVSDYVAMFCLWPETGLS